jgi:hypothetical protein
MNRTWDWCFSCAECVYDGLGECKTHNRLMNPNVEFCAHVFDLVAVQTCNDNERDALLKETTPEVIKDFCYQ